jgi:membrane protein
LLWGPLFGAGHGAVPAQVAWVVARWLIVAIAAVLIIVLLYWGTPNVRQPRVQWLSVGGATALVLMAAASGAFAFYVSHFPTFHREYGSVAALVVFLVWLWLMNLMLLFGAAWDVELERVRELQAGTDARTALQLPLRDDRRIETLERREQRLEHEAGRFLEARQGERLVGQNAAEGARDAQPARDDAGAADGLVDHGPHPDDAAPPVGHGQQEAPGGAAGERAEQLDAAESVGVHERGAAAVRGGDPLQ